MVVTSGQSSAGSWKDRLKENIRLTAPDGTVFTARWRRGDITGEKRVGEFNFPLVDGTITQDVGLSSDKYALSLFFEGDNHDVQAWSFKQALRQRGTWTVVHPVYGSKRLQPIGMNTLKADPATSGNITVVATNWIESPQTGSSPSAQEIGAKISGQADVVGTASAAQFLAGTDLNDADAVGMTISSGKSLADLFKGSALGKMISGVSTAAAGLTTAYDTVVADLSAATLNPETIATDIQGLVGLGVNATQNLPGIATAFVGFINSVIDNLPTGNDSAAKNQAEISEVFAVAALTSFAKAIAVTAPITRAQCVSAATTLSDAFTSVVNALDAVQGRFQGLYASLQYFSASTTYSDLAILMGLAVQYLLTILFDLRVARTFTLTRPRAPIEIAITEYGAEYDANQNSNLDLLLLTNDLHGRDMLVVPAGREITIYEAVA